MEYIVFTSLYLFFSKYRIVWPSQYLTIQTQEQIYKLNICHVLLDDNWKYSFCPNFCVTFHQIVFRKRFNGWSVLNDWTRRNWCVSFSSTIASLSAGGTAPTSTSTTSFGGESENKTVICASVKTLKVIRVQQLNKRLLKSLLTKVYEDDY